MTLDSLITHLLDCVCKKRYFWRMATFTRNQQTGELVIAMLILMGLTITTILLLVLIFGTYMMMVYVGMEYKNECPAQPFIPTFLMVWGCLGIARNLIICVNEDSEVYNSLVKIIEMFLCVWFLFGIVWIIKIYPPDFDNPKSDDYCNEVIYLLALALVVCPLLLNYLQSVCFILEYKV